MGNLKYLKKIIEPQIERYNQDIDYKNIKTSQDLFELLTENMGFKYYGVIVKNDNIILCGYRHSMQIDGNIVNIDPSIKINDFRVIKANVGKKPSEMKQIYKEMNEKLQNFIKYKLSYLDGKAYKEDFEEYKNPKKERLEKYKQEGNYIDLE